MPTIRNSELIKKFTDFFKLKTNDMLGSEAGRMLVPVVSVPITKTKVLFAPTEAQYSAGTIRVPSKRRWKILGIHFLWTSDVNAGNREIRIRFLDNTRSVDIISIASRNLQAASLAVSYNIGPGLSHVGSASGLFQTIPLPKDLILNENTGIIISDVAAIAAGDTLTNSSLIIEEEIILEDEFDER